MDIPSRILQAPAGIVGRPDAAAGAGRLAAARRPPGGADSHGRRRRIAGGMPVLYNTHVYNPVVLSQSLMKMMRKFPDDPIVSGWSNTSLILVK